MKSVTVVYTLKRNIEDYSVFLDFGKNMSYTTLNLNLHMLKIQQIHDYAR